MKVSDLFVRCLENEDVEYIFGIPGEENLDLMNSLADSRIKFIAARHEQGAALIADVYGRLTGKAGVCLATLGPGATNLMTGVADASMDRAPLVAITGQAALAVTHKEYHQLIDVVKAFSPITKWTASITTPDKTAEVIRKAFRIAQIEKPGATHIELPEDVAEAETEMAPLNKVSDPYIRPHADEIRRAAALIGKAKFPLILAGNGVIRTESSKELIAMVEAANMPVLSTFMSKGAVPANHPLFLSTVGLQARDYAMCGFDKADTIIAVGYDLAEYAPVHWNSNRDKTIIHIDTARAETDSYYNVASELVGSIRYTLGRLAGMVTKREPNSYVKRLKKFLETELTTVEDYDGFPLKPQRIILDMRKALGDEDILVSDVGAHKIWIARIYPAAKPNTVIISNGFASMGIALPGAIGAKLAKPNRKIVAATGDGGFLMNSQELETAKRLGTPFVVVIFNNSKYGSIEWKQLNKFKRTYGVEFGNPDFVKYAESFDARGFRIQSSPDFLPTLQKALTSNELCVIDVPVDYSENLRLTEKLGKMICPM